jgi:hypothetical protein
MQKNSEEKIYPASLTKMMTAIQPTNNPGGITFYSTVFEDLNNQNM